MAANTKHLARSSSGVSCSLSGGTLLSADGAEAVTVSFAASPADAHAALAEIRRLLGLRADCAPAEVVAVVQARITPAPRRPGRPRTLHLGHAGELIDARLTAMGLSVNELSRRSGVRVPSLTGLRGGWLGARPDTAAVIAGVLGIPLKELMQALEQDRQARLARQGVRP